MGDTTKRHVFSVKGMHCHACVALVTEALEEAGAHGVAVRLDPAKRIGTVTAESALPAPELKAIIERQGDYRAS